MRATIFSPANLEIGSDDLPLLVRGSVVLHNPSNIEAATALNLGARKRRGQRGMP